MCEILSCVMATHLESCIENIFVSSGLAGNVTVLRSVTLMTLHRYKIDYFY